MRLFLLVVSHFLMAMATKVLYIVPENSVNGNCPTLPCITLSQYLLTNSSASDFTLYLLPGKHHVSTNIEMWNVSNISIIGINHISSSDVGMLVKITHCIL